MQHWTPFFSLRVVWDWSAYVLFKYYWCNSALSSWSICWRQLMIYVCPVCFIKHFLCMFLKTECWTRWTTDVLYYGNYILHFPSYIPLFSHSFHLFKKYLSIWYKLLSLVLFLYWFTNFHSLLQQNKFFLESMIKFWKETL